jgi:hypothetical protein
MKRPFGPFADSTQKLEFSNNSAKTLEVMVEMVPDRHVLQPGDTMFLVADEKGAPRNEGYSVIVHDSGFQIYAAWDWEPIAYINGQLAEPDWTTPLEPASK